jgi:penicillin-binding protein 1C
LGGREEATAPEHCAVRRTGWLLHGTAPPTLPDRQRSDGLLAPRPFGCGHSLPPVPGPASAPTASAAPSDAASGWVARWPVALGPWVEPLPCAAGSPAGAGSAAIQLRLTGLDDGAWLKAVPGQQHIALSVGVVGAVPGQRLYWLLDGQPLSTAAAPAMLGHTLRLNLTQAGPHQLTVMDEQGRFARVGFRVLIQ